MDRERQSPHRPGGEIGRVEMEPGPGIPPPPPGGAAAAAAGLPGLHPAEDLIAGGREPREVPTLRERWTALPPRSRRAALAAAGLAVLTALAAGGYGLTRPPARQAAAPPPWPAQSVAFSYTGPGATEEAGPRSFSFRLKVTDTSGSVPVTIEAVTQQYAGLSVSVRPATPVAVAPGHTVGIEVIFRILNCRSAPAGAQLPFLDVTLRNMRAIQTQSQIMGDRYARDLSSALAARCPHSR